MYFTLPTSSKTTVPAFYGYKLGECGGNYVEFTSDKIKFSFHKDFKLYRNSDIQLTNIEIEGEELPNDIIEYDLKTGDYVRKQFDIGTLDYDTVINRVTELLLENIKSCAKLSFPKIVYTAGLDSSTLAYLAYFNNIDFTCLIHEKYTDRFTVPFSKIEYVQYQTLPEFPISNGSSYNIKPGFYQLEHSNLITGYYGDNTILHHKELYHQTRHLHNVPVKLYDLTPPQVNTLLNSKTEIINAVLYINTQNYFRQWFDCFQILDPYRDPRLIETILSLPLNDLIEQFGSGNIQKTIIKNMNTSWAENICEFKNDYSKF